MKHLSTLFALLLLALGSAPAHAEPADIAAAARSVVRVVLIAQYNGEFSLVGHGSGVAVGPNLILTNAHVVQPAQEADMIRIGVVPSEGKTGWFGQVVSVSPGNDLALIRIGENGALPAATLFTGPVGDGADVFAIGYPGNVDLAQGYDVGDLVTPTAPVKTRGNISAGRASRQFDTLLHTAPIGAGNSGGPLLDACGRVIGINSFGTVADSGDSEFYFAVSMREVSRFLLAAGIKPHGNGAPCRSIADLDRAEAERLAGEKALSDENARALTAKAESARREAQLDVIGRRENGMALAGVALLLALTSVGAAFLFAQRQNRRGAIAAGVVAVLLLGGGVVAWMTRPTLATIDSPDDTTEAQASGTPSPAAGAFSGDLVCVLDPDRSRVTVSEGNDVPLSWRADGCANGRTQYALDAQGWSSLSVADGEDSATVSRFDPATGTLRADRYLLGLEDMTRLRAANQKLAAPACGGATSNGGANAARDLASAQGALRGLLPATPNERLLYRCQKAK